VTAAGARNALDLIFSGAGGRTVLTRRRYRWPLLIGRVFPDTAQPRAGVVTIQNAAGTIIPGDVIRQRIEVVESGYAVVGGQGATVVSGVAGGDLAEEETYLRVDAHSGLVFDTPPRIITAYARYRQRTHLYAEHGARAVLVDAVVLHPDLQDANFGSYESSVAIHADDGSLLALDTQFLAAMPRVLRSPKAFATLYIVGRTDDPAVPTALLDIERLTVMTSDASVYIGVSDLPNGAGWAVRIASHDGGRLRATISWAVRTIRAAQQPPRDPQHPVRNGCSGRMRDRGGAALSRWAELGREVG